MVSNLAAAAHNSLYRRITISSCRSAVSKNVHNWAWPVYKEVRGEG